MTTKMQRIIHGIEIEAKSYFDRYSKIINTAHDWGHVLRVVKNCEKILQYETQANEYEVLIAAYLHDVGRYKDEDGEHSEWSYVESVGILKPYAEQLKDKIDIDKTLAIVRYHSLKPENVPDQSIGNSIEFLILTDADKIDMFGPVGILRAPCDPRFKTLKDQIKHIKEKINPEEYVLKTDGGRKIGQKQKEYLSVFLDLYNKQGN